MRSFVPSLAALALVGACAVSAHREPPASGARYARTTPPVRDTAAVRRLCVASDSVLAGKRACELRNQAPPIRVF